MNAYNQDVGDFLGFDNLLFGLKLAVELHKIQILAHKRKEKESVKEGEMES